MIRNNDINSVVIDKKKYLMIETKQIFSHFFYFQFIQQQKMVYRDFD